MIRAAPRVIATTQTRIVQNQFSSGCRRGATWIFLQRPTVYVARALSPSPRYRFAISLPEGQFDDDVRASVIQQVTRAVARAEGGAFDEVSPASGCSQPRSPTAPGADAAKCAACQTSSRGWPASNTGRMRSGASRSDDRASDLGDHRPLDERDGARAPSPRPRSTSSRYRCAGSADQLPQRVGLVLGHDATRRLIQRAQRRTRDHGTAPSRRALNSRCRRRDS